MCFVKQLFLEILDNSQENTCAGMLILITLQAEEVSFLTKLKSENFLKIGKKTPVREFCF